MKERGIEKGNREDRHTNSETDRPTASKKVSATADRQTDRKTSTDIFINFIKIK